jgi:hypothetical protein
MKLNTHLSRLVSPMVLSIALVGCASSSPEGDDEDELKRRDGGVRDAATDAMNLPRDAGADASIPAMSGKFTYRFDDAISSVVNHAGSLFFAGFFTEATRSPVQGLGAFAQDGTPKSCLIGSGLAFGDPKAIVHFGGSIYVGGYFDTFQGKLAKNIAKIDATTCQLDTTFSPPGNNGFGGPVNALVVANGSLYVGGSFDTYRGAVGAARNIAKLDLSSGALDSRFSHSAPLEVASLAVSGNAVFGTCFDFANWNRSHLIRLDANTGQPDPGFNPPDDNSYRYTSLAVSGNGLILGRTFALGPSNTLSRIDATTGRVDPNFQGFQSSDRNPSVLTLLAAGPDLYVGGNFATYGGALHKGIVKINALTGLANPGFSSSNTTPNIEIRTISVAGNTLYAGGKFESYDGANVSNFARLDASTGKVDGSFVPFDSGFGGTLAPVDVAHAVGTEVFVGGSVHGLGGHRYPQLLKMDASNYKVDVAFSSVASKQIVGRPMMMVALGTSLYVLTSASRVLKLDVVTGRLDTAFSLPALSNIAHIAIGGGSLLVTSKSSITGPVRLSRHNANSGALEPAFGSNNLFNERVWGIASLGTSVYVVGDFTSYRGVANAANRIAKLDLSNGDLDTAFSPPSLNGTDERIETIAATPSGLFVRGRFSAYRGIAADRLIKIDRVTGQLDTMFRPALPPRRPGGIDINEIGFCGSDLMVGERVEAGIDPISRVSSLTGAKIPTFSPPKTRFTPFGFVALGTACMVFGTGSFVGDDRGVILIDNASGAQR